MKLEWATQQPITADRKSEEKVEMRITRFHSSYLPLTSPELSEVRERPFPTPLPSFAGNSR
jgi:hypothetical protein